MSQWTHVTGAIRIDGMPKMRPDMYNVEEVKKILGFTCNFDSSEENWNKCTVPCGSEGSIQYRIHEYDTGLLWAIITIWGDLRDYGSVEDLEKIKVWFLGVCNKWPLMRQGVLQVQTEGQNIVLEYVSKER